jgi:hypothetical protein
VRRFWWVLLIAPLFLNFQARRGDFAGSWELDLKKSVNLPASFKNVESFILEIRQKGDSLTVLANMRGKGADGKVQNVPFPPFIYVMDGKEGYRKDSIRGSERWMSAHWGSDGKSVVMDTRARVIQAGRPPTEFSQHDVWKKVGDSTLDIAITQKTTGSDSVRTERRIYRKLK